jgi:hypothetical protein
MKRPATIGLSIVIVVAFILLLWQHAKSSRDRKFSQNLAGIWSWEIYSLHGTRNFAADGSFTEQTVFKGTKTNQTAGTWHVKDGRVIVIVTSDSNKKAQVPRTNSEQIVHIDAHEFIGAFGTAKFVLNRVTP